MSPTSAAQPQPLRLNEIVVDRYHARNGMFPLRLRVWDVESSAYPSRNLLTGEKQSVQARLGLPPNPKQTQGSPPGSRRLRIALGYVENHSDIANTNRALHNIKGALSAAVVLPIDAV